MDVEVADNPDKARFEIVADGELAGFLQYHLRDGVIAQFGPRLEVLRAFAMPARGGHAVEPKVAQLPVERLRRS